MDDPATAGFDTGFDFGTGFGLIQADAALALVVHHWSRSGPSRPGPPVAASRARSS